MFLDMLVRLRTIVFTAVVLLLCACDDSILAQNPAESFVGGKPPASLFRLANQIWELPSTEKIAIRVLKDSENQYLIRVGVTDGGVDIANKDLIDQIDFKIKDGRLVSAGLDTRAGDLFGSPQLVRYEYYAFGAEGIAENLILNAPQDPLKILAQYDKDFLAEFIPKLKAHPVLKNTLFAKLNEKNFSIIGAHRFALEEFNALAYEADLKQGRLLYPGWTPKTKNPLEISAGFEFNYAYIFEDWELGELGMPVSRGALIDHPMTYSAGVMLREFKGAKEFNEFVKNEFAAFSKRSGYEKDFKQLMEYMRTRFFDVSASADSRAAKALDVLAEGIYFTKMGYLNYDPIRSFEDAVYTAALQRKLHNLMIWPSEKVVPGPEDVKAASREILGTYQEVAQHVLAHPEKYSLDEAAAAERFLAKFKKWAGLLEEYLEKKGWDPSRFRNYSDMTPEMKSLYRKYLVRTGNPILNVKSIESSHGTHVAGIIAHQNPNIRIVPIRVVLGSVKRSPVKDQEMFKNFKKGFAEWMHEPLVMKALEGRFGSAFPGKHGADLVQEILALFEKDFPAHLEESRSSIRFLEEINQTIEYAGNEKLKLVNLSIGMNFDKKVLDYKNLDIRKQIRAYYEFLEFEHYKWIVGKAVNEKAPGTLFIIATGNDGAWKDGRSKSGLPVDLSSPFLADFEDPAHGLVAPNNKIKNILGVGSLSQVDEISSFSNLLISKTKMVMAHGEEVLSPIRSISNEAFTEQWNSEASISRAADKLSEVMGSKERMDDFLIQKYKITGTPEQIKDKLEILRGQLRIQAKAVESVDMGMKMHYFLQFPNLRAHMSGTSMATPTITGLLASEVQERAFAAKIPADELYLHPDFMPEKMIDIVFQKSEPVDKGSPILLLRKWIGEKVWPKSQEEVAFRNKLKEVEEKKSKFVESVDPNFCPNLTRKKKKWFFF